MIIRTFLDKCTTIVRGLDDNFGLYPVGMLSYGPTLSRALIHFETDKIKDKIGVGADAKHILKFTNCGDIDRKQFKDKLPSSDEMIVKERATSFDVIVFKLPQKWDEGRGFDFSTDFWLIGDQSVSSEGSNWFQSYNGLKWPENGVYSNNTLSLELNKFNNGEESLIIARQHFDHGNENFELDVTSYVNDVLGGHENYGLGIAFSPMYELMEPKYTQYVGFFSNTTRTFFEPVLETRLNNAVHDDRNNVVLGKENRLFLYAFVNGVPVEFDEMPQCTINDEKYDVVKLKKGYYYAKVNFARGAFGKDTILYDVWSNLKYCGASVDDVEMSFVINDGADYFGFGKPIDVTKKYNVSLVGIDDFEKIYQGDIRVVKTLFRVPYTSSEYVLKGNASYRLYVKDGDREFDVIEWDSIEQLSDYNFFTIDTSELVPNEYHVDICVNNGLSKQVFKNELTFTIVDNITGRNI